MATDYRHVEFNPTMDYFGHSALGEIIRANEPEGWALLRVVPSSQYQWVAVFERPQLIDGSPEPPYEVSAEKPPPLRSNRIGDPRYGGPYAEYDGAWHPYQSDDELGLSVCDVCGAPADKPQHIDG